MAKSRLLMPFRTTAIFLQVVAMAFCLYGVSERVGGGANRSDAYASIGSSDYSSINILVKYKSDVTDSTARMIGYLTQTVETDVIEQLDVKVLRVPEHKTIEDMVSIYMQNGNVEYAEPDYEMEFFETIPNDPNYSAMRLGLTVLEMQRAWDYTTGTHDVVVAIVDSGVNINHPDLQANMLPYGHSVISDMSYSVDSTGHGTGVAGTVGTVGNNGIGGVGISWTVSLLPVKISTASTFPMSNAINGVLWAADNGAHIINMSWGSVANSTSLSNAMNYAHNKNILLVAASGNSGKEEFHYPASLPNVMAIGGSASGNSKAAVTTYGPWISMLAITSYNTTNASGGYSGMGGTSFSSPQVAGLAALLKSYNPALTNTQIQYYLEQGALDLGPPGWDKFTGYGFMNGYYSLNLLASDMGLEPRISFPTIGNVPKQVVPLGSTITHQLQVSGGVAPYTFASTTYAYSPEGELSTTSASTGQIAGLTASVNSGGLATITGNTEGDWWACNKVTDALGNYKFNCLEVAVTASVDDVVITTTALPPATLDQAYSYTVDASGGTLPYTWSATGLPNGLGINSSTGVIAGTPTMLGNFQTTITVKDSVNVTQSKLLSLTINAVLPDIEISGIQNGGIISPSANTKIVATASHPSGIHKIEIHIDGKLVALCSSPRDNKCDVYIKGSNTTIGDHTLQVSATANDTNRTTHTASLGFRR